MRRAVIEADEPTERLDLNLNTKVGPYNLAVEKGEETVYVHRQDLPDPSGDRGHTIELPIDQREVNQHTYFEAAGRGHSNSASSSSHKDHVDFLGLRDGEWIYYTTHVTNPYSGQDTESKYQQTNVPGVEITTVFSRGNQTESAHKKRIRVNREAIDEHDALYALCYRIEKGGSINGEYHRVKNTAAVELVGGDD